MIIVHSICADCRYCWPVGEKKQEQEFRKICNNWLAEISKVCFCIYVIACAPLNYSSSVFFKFMISIYCIFLCIGYTNYVTKYCVTTKNGHKM